MRKRTKITITAVVAVFGAVLLACAACLALMPSASSRYVDEEHYAGEVWVNGTDYSINHEDHDGWTNLNDAVGTETSYTITEGGQYYLSGDLTANITVTATGGVDLCLNGYALTCYNVSSSAILIGSTGSSSNVVFSLYDCGGSKDETGDYHNVHYYKYRDGAVIEGETFHTGFDFSDGGIDPSHPDTYDGYVRGGLITGASITTGSYQGGGVTVGYGCTFNMYGGTIAGNANTIGSAAAGVLVYRSTFNMYGGTIAGNRYTNGNSGSSGGSGVGLSCNNTSKSQYVATINMYGGEIRENYDSVAGGAGIRAHYDNLNDAFVIRIYGGTVSDNICNYSGSTRGGGGIELYASSTSSGSGFCMSGGTVRDNVSVSSGGGIYLYGEIDNCEFVGGTVTGNRSFYSSGHGGGICFDFISENGMTIGGSAYIYGNYLCGKVSNLDLCSKNADKLYITLSTSLSLTDGARIGVTVNSAQTQITTNYYEGAEAYFLSDDRTFRVTVDSTSTYLQLS